MLCCVSWPFFMSFLWMSRHASCLAILFARVRHVVDSLRVNKVQDYVEEHYMEEIRLSTLADMVGMTSVSFSRFFRHSTGQTFSDYLIAVRLEHASRLLLDSHLPIAEVCF